MQLKPNHLTTLRTEAGKITSDRVRECINVVDEAKKAKSAIRKVSGNLTEKYFQGMNAGQINEILEQT